MRYDFNNIKRHYFNNSEISVVVGKKFDLIQRINMADNIEGDNIVYDTESSKVFKRPNNLVLIKGSVEYRQYWDNDGDVVADDIDRYKTLSAGDKIRNGTYEQTDTSTAITDKELITKYTFGCDYDEFHSKANAWTLAAKTSVQAKEDDTRFFCFISEIDYDLKIIDIDVGQTKTINKSDGTNYIFFSANCSVGEVNIPENDLKQLTSSSLSIKNESDRPARIIKVVY